MVYSSEIITVLHRFYIFLSPFMSFDRFVEISNYIESTERAPFSSEFSQWGTSTCYLSLRWCPRKMRFPSDLARILSSQFYHIIRKQIIVIYTREACPIPVVAYLGVVTNWHAFPSDQMRRKPFLGLGTFCLRRSVQSVFIESDYLAETIHGKMIYHSYSFI